MAIGRSRFAPTSTTTTKGHSVLRQRSYNMPSRNLPPVTTPRSHAYTTRAEEYLLADRVSDANFVSNSLMDNNDSAAIRSRGRDQQLLKEATNAIPRGSVLDTASLTSSPTPFGARRFPRRFGKASLRKNQGNRFYSNPLRSDEESSLPSSELVASAAPAPNKGFQRYGRGRPSYTVRSYFGDDDASPDTSPHPSRASSVEMSLPTSNLHASRPPVSSSRARGHLPPYPLTGVSEKKVLDRCRQPWGQSLSLSRFSSLSPQRDPVYIRDDPDITPGPLPRRRQKVLASSRRPAGNYYERLLRKRSKRQGRLGAYYDVESIEGSDLSGVLSDTGSQDGTYDYDYDNESTSVLPSSSYQPLSSSSPYYVDQNTEYVPFKPTRSLETNGLLEVTPYNNDNGDDYSSSPSLPSPTTDMYISKYLPSSLVSSARSASTSSLPYRTVLPYTSPSPSDSLAVEPYYPSTPSQKLLEALVSTSVERAKNTINSLAVPEYSGASLLLSVEGQGISTEGKRVDFTYTPPPIPLYGRTLALEDKALPLDVKPSPSIKPLDDFLSGYMKRMGALRDSLYGHLDRDRERRIKCGLQPLDTGPLPSRTSSRYTPTTSTSDTSATYDSIIVTSPYRPYYRSSYTQSHDYVPVRHLSSHKVEHVPVTSYRRQGEDGHTQRLDVFSLGEYRPRLSSSVAREIDIPASAIPASATGGHQLSVLDKINIKAAIIASKLEPDPIKRRRPRSEYAANKYRELRRESQEKSASSGAYGSSSGEGSSRPVSDLRRRIRKTLDNSYS